MPRNIIIAGGGTGGHIFPAIAIAQSLQQLGSNLHIQFIGALGKMEMDKIPAAGYPIIGLPIIGFNRKNIFKNILLPFRLIISFKNLISIFKKIKPIAVIGVGGYSSFPVLRYAQFKNIPTFIHESNSIAGKSNLFLSKRVHKIFAGSEALLKYFPNQKIILTGNPIRKSILQKKYTKKEAIDFFKFKEDKITLLIIGGSLGAKSINECIFRNINELQNNNIQTIWQTGKVNAEHYKNISPEYKNDVYITQFIDDMTLAYTAADLIISRSGAMAIAELCYIGKPTIFVPYPYAAEDHQKINALALVQKNAALLIEDAKVESNLIAQIVALKNDIPLQLEMANNIQKLMITDAAEKIAQEILNEIK